MKKYYRVKSKVKKWYRGRGIKRRKLGKKGYLRVYSSWKSLKAGRYYWMMRGYKCGKYWKEKAKWELFPKYKFYCYK